MDELEAVNMLLRLIGSRPVNSLSNTHPDVSNAKVTLERARVNLQRRDLWFNTDHDVLLHPQANGEILVPANVHRMIVTDMAKTTVLTERAGKLYNPQTQSTLFTGPVLVQEIVSALPWDSMPASAQITAAYLAARQFVRDEIEDMAKVADLERDIAESMMQLNQEDLRQSQVNIFNKSSARRLHQWVGPFRRW